MNEQVRKLYDQANYPALKAQIEAQVVRWFWAGGGMGLFSLEPFYFEQNRFPKSKILKEAPKDTDNKYQYGVNEKDEIIVVHSYIGCEGDYYEEFYFREENQIISYHFDFASKKKCINTKIFIYKDGLLQSIHSAFDNNTRSAIPMICRGNSIVLPAKPAMYIIRRRIRKSVIKPSRKKLWNATMHYWCLPLRHIP